MTMTKIYRVQMNSKGMPNFSTAEEIAYRPQEWIDDIISRLESMAEDMRAMGDVEKAMGVDSALWLIEMMKGTDDE